MSGQNEISQLIVIKSLTFNIYYNSYPIQPAAMLFIQGESYRRQRRYLDIRTPI